MNSKIDFLKDCLSDVSGKLGRMVPIDDFNRTFCVVCVNGECARSKSNNLKFEYRANNWQDIYFNKVARADVNDPKFENIRIKRFVSPAEQHTYVMNTPTPEQPSESAIPVISSAPVVVSEIELRSEPVPKAEVAPPIESPSTSPSDADAIIGPQTQNNTEFVQGTMLPKPESKEVTLDSGQVFIFDDED